MSAPASAGPAAVLAWDRIERVAVHLVALHSLAVGVALVFATEWSLAFGGWPNPGPAFFARQGGAFHFVVAIAYVREFQRSRSVSLMLLAKTIGTIFLAGMTLAGGAPWVVPASCAGDAGMGLGIWFLHRKVCAMRNP